MKISKYKSYDKLIVPAVPVVSGLLSLVFLMSGWSGGTSTLLLDPSDKVWII